jgi:hypothetical protein
VNEKDVGRSGIEPDFCRLKGGCITIVANAPFFFWPVFHGHELPFHVRNLRNDEGRSRLPEAAFLLRVMRVMRVMEEPPLGTAIAEQNAERPSKLIFRAPGKRREFRRRTHHGFMMRTAPRADS